MAEQGDPKEPARRSGESVAWLPVALLVVAILVLIAIAGFAGTY
jgi:hypothetical protein